MFSDYGITLFDASYYRFSITPTPANVYAYWNTEVVEMYTESTWKDKDVELSLSWESLEPSETSINLKEWTIDWNFSEIWSEYPK